MWGGDLRTRDSPRRALRLPGLIKRTQGLHMPTAAAHGLGHNLDTAVRLFIKLLKSLALPRGLEPLFSP
jgi:hypothetical protein